jgi:hypothetical protein
VSEVSFQRSFCTAREDQKDFRCLQIEILDTRKSTNSGAVEALVESSFLDFIVLIIPIHCIEVLVTTMNVARLTATVSNERLMPVYGVSS